MAKLHDSSKSTIEGLPTRGRKTILSLFEYIEKNPIIDTQRTAKALGISYNTASKAIAALVDIGILSQTAKSGKASIYSYWQYLEILRQGT